jgi:hypothetical protein
VARRTLLVGTSPQRAFEYLSDFTRHAEWAQHELRIDAPQSGAAIAGTRLQSHGRQLGQKLDDELTVTAYEPGRRFAFESRGRGGLFRHVFDFTPAPGGTLVGKEMTVLSMPFPLSLTKWITEPFLARRLASDLRRIKAHLEM